MIPVRRPIFLIAMFCSMLAAFNVAHAQTPDAESTATAAPPPPPARVSESFPSVDANYVLGRGDVIEVAVVGQSDYNARVRVTPDGNILLPLIGSLPAESKRPADVATLVSAALTKGGYFAQPVVRVDVVLVASRFITVFGQVGSPGLVTLDRSYRLSEILARVGARFAGGSEQVIITHADGSQERLSMLDIATGGADKDPLVATGDKIYVPGAANQVFYISGAVRSPGAFPVVPELTVRTALARAGGITENGSEKKVEIYRNGEKIKKPDLNTKVEVGDIIKFGERML